MGVGRRGEFFCRDFSQSHHETKPEWNSLLNTRSSPDCLYGTNLDLSWKTTFQRKILEAIKGFPCWGLAPRESCKGLPGPVGQCGDWILWGIYLEAAQSVQFRVVLLNKILSLQNCLSQYPLVEVVKLTIVAKPILLTNLQQIFLNVCFIGL